MKSLLALAILGMLLTGCSKSVDSKSKTFTYPLALGNQWTYSMVVTWTHRDPVRVDTIPSGADIVKLTIEQADTIRPGVISYKMRGIDVGSEMVNGIPDATYLNLPEGMYRLSRTESFSANVVLAMPRQVPHQPGVVPGTPSPVLLANTNCVLSAFPDPAGPSVCQAANPADTLPLILAYPQHSGELWTVRDSGSASGFRIDKLIEGRETITTPAGSFDCWRIRILYYSNGVQLSSADVEEYVSAEGLIRRRFAGGPSNSYWVTTFELTSFALH